MMDQLGITRLTPGPSPDPKAPNAANYDEARANPFPVLPDPLRTDDGRAVATAEQWRTVRRPEILAAYEREVYGRVPGTAPRIDWRVVITDRERVGFIPVIARRVIGHADNSAAPDITVDIRMTVVTPANAKGPVPLLIMFGRDDFPAPSEPSRAEYERIDAAMKKMLIAQDPALRSVFDAHPAFMLNPQPPFRMAQRDAHGDYPRPDQLIAAGWGYAMLDTETIQPDDAGALQRGVIGLSNRGRPRTPDQWGALRAWAWGASRALDFLSKDAAVDARRIGIEGVSRYGKAALVAMAFDQRFATGLIGSSGKGGTTLLRRNFGEAVTSLSYGAHHWMAGNFLRYGAAAGRDVRTAADLPVDAHELIALCAPRPVFISYGIPEQGDDHWLDHRGSLMAVVAADRVYRLLSARGLGLGDDYRSVTLPPVNTGLLDGDVAWRQHDGGHTDTPNLNYFLQWADRHLPSAR
ncbi:MAG: acetylxylan esterase [Sphingobium sp.]|nr:MAG: acetylxylan esterase [Sphingobium sp.]